MTRRKICGRCQKMLEVWSQIAKENGAAHGPSTPPDGTSSKKRKRSNKEKYVPKDGYLKSHSGNSITDTESEITEVETMDEAKFRNKSTHSASKGRPSSIAEQTEGKSNEDTNTGDSDEAEFGTRRRFVSKKKPSTGQ